LFLKSNNELDNLRLIEITNGTELLNIKLNNEIAVHINNKELLMGIRLFDYNCKLHNLLATNDKDKIKKFMKEYINANYYWEFNFMESYDSDKLEEDIKVGISLMLEHGYNRLLSNINTARKLFTSNKRKLNNVSELDRLLDEAPILYNVYSGEYIELPASISMYGRQCTEMPPEAIRANKMGPSKQLILKRDTN
jgi:hypothetical protein